MIDEETELYICTIEMCIYGILFKAKQYIDGSDHRAKETKLEHHYKNIESYERTLWIKYLGKNLAEDKDKQNILNQK